MFFDALPRKMADMNPLFISLLCFLGLVGSVSADSVVKTFPGGDGKELLENPRDPDSGGGALIRDEECAKSTMKGERLNTGEPNPEYARCVHDKLEKRKKKGDH